jgi:hypothetical protein
MSVMMHFPVGRHPTRGGCCFLFPAPRCSMAALLDGCVHGVHPVVEALQVQHQAVQQVRVHLQCTQATRQRLLVWGRVETESLLRAGRIHAHLDGHVHRVVFEQIRRGVRREGSVLLAA